jgi:uncharacterized membrane protein
MSFLKTTLLGGLFLLLPIMLLWVGLQEIGGLLVAMATPIADMLPGKFFEDLLAPGVIALILIVGTSFVLGLAAKATWLRDLGRKFESSVLYKIPMYQMLKVISGALVDYDGSQVDAALVRDETGGGDPCYIMEKHADGRATVLLPWSPASFAGSIKVVQQSQLEILPCSLDEFSRSLSQMGVGVEECMATPPSENQQS